MLERLLLEILQEHYPDVHVGRNIYVSDLRLDVNDL